MKVELWYPTRERLTRQTARWAIWMGRTFPKVEQFIGPEAPYCTWGPDRARNRIVESFLTRDAEWLWMVDADTVPPFDKKFVAHFLHQETGPVTTGVVCGYNASRGGSILPGGWMEIMGLFRSLYVWDYDSEGKIQGWIPLRDDQPASKAEACGTACIKIHRSVFEKITKPYFHVIEDKYSEDLFFCSQLKAKDIPLAVDEGMKCDHWKEVELGDYADLE